MEKASKRVTVYLQPEYHHALRVKAAETEYSVSELVNEAVQNALREDARDLEQIPRPSGCRKLSGKASREDNEKAGREAGGKGEEREGDEPAGRENRKGCEGEGAGKKDGS